MITLENVTKEFPGKKAVTALRDVTLTIERGEMVAIVGSSGSGKSTLLNLIGGLDRPSAGKIRIDGRELSLLDDDALTRLRREKVGFVFQFFNLIETLTAFENIAIPLYLCGVHKAEIAERVVQLLRLVGLEQRGDHLPDELSGGEQQRVALARALVMNPPILLADEPTGNLDSQTGQDILHLIRDLRRQFHSTVVMVTHDPAAAASCERTVTLQDGRIVSGTGHQELAHAAKSEGS